MLQTVVRISPLDMVDEMMFCGTHMESRKHKDILNLRDGASITNFFCSPVTSAASEHMLQVTHAEVLMVELIAHHNLPLAAADMFTGGFKRMFPDSRVAAG